MSVPSMACKPSGARSEFFMVLFIVRTFLPEGGEGNIQSGISCLGTSNLGAVFDSDLNYVSNIF